MDELTRTDFKVEKIHTKSGKLIDSYILSDYSSNKITRYMEKLAYETMLSVLNNIAYSENDDIELNISDDKMKITIQVNSNIEYTISCHMIEVYTDGLRVYRDFSITHYNNELYLVSPLGKMIHKRQILNESLGDAFEKLYNYIDNFINLLNGEPINHFTKNEKEN